MYFVCVSEQTATLHSATLIRLYKLDD